MDKEYIKTLFVERDGEDDRLIKRGDYIDRELIEILCKHSTTDIKKAFCTYERYSEQAPKFLIDLKCPSCGKIHRKGFSKSRIVQIIKCFDKNETTSEFLCAECERIESIKSQERMKQWEKENKRKQELETQEYIDLYLNPDHCFKEGVSATEKIDLIIHKAPPLGDKIKEAILKMKYYDFLRTPYWDGVRNYKLRKEKYRCQLCGKNGTLNVHHKTYENHGMEHVKSIAFNDLIVLCKDCHGKFHDKLSE